MVQANVLILSFFLFSLALPLLLLSLPSVQSPSGFFFFVIAKKTRLPSDCL